MTLAHYCYLLCDLQIRYFKGHLQTGNAGRKLQLLIWWKVCASHTKSAFTLIFHATCISSAVIPLSLPGFSCFASHSINLLRTFSFFQYLMKCSSQALGPWKEQKSFAALFARSTVRIVLMAPSKWQSTFLGCEINKPFWTEAAALSCLHTSSVLQVLLLHRLLTKFVYFFKYHVSTQFLSLWSEVCVNRKITLTDHVIAVFGECFPLVCKLIFGYDTWKCAKTVQKGLALEGSLVSVHINWNCHAEPVGSR